MASRYFNRKYLQILKWGFTSREDTNYTYELTEGNILAMAQAVAFVTKREPVEIRAYIREARENTALKDHILSRVKNTPEGRFADREVRFG